MPNNKQNQGQGQPQNGGVGQGAQEQAQKVGQQIQEGAQQVGNRIKEGYGSAREGALHGYRQAEGAIARNPAPSILIGFGVGFGLGLVVCSMLVAKREETWGEKYLPESLQDLPDRYKSLVSSLKTLPKQVHQYLPDSISKHIG